MKNESELPPVRVLKAAVCPSLTNQSKLSYEIGCGPASDIQVRITKNSGTGFFSTDWVVWEDLLKVLAKNAGMPITSNTFRPLFVGRSANNAGFLLAVLKHEGLVQAMESGRRKYQCMDGREFIAQVHALMGTSPVASKKPGKAFKAKVPARPTKR